MYERSRGPATQQRPDEVNGARYTGAPSPPPSVTPSEDGGVRKRVCSCGTILMFPPATSSRTCWSCKSLVERDSSQSSRPSPTGLKMLSPQAPTPGFQARSVSDIGADVVSTSRKRYTWLAWCLLIISLGANSGFLMWYNSKNPTPIYRDRDGDGVPDQHDYCPTLCAGSNCSRSGWISGKSTDFDGDGCEDGVEDRDMDNDEVADTVDKCPKTPQQYCFVSDGLSDYDHDGCADGLEDTDDDNDGIHNKEDKCSRTAAGDASDHLGCSKEQADAEKRPREPLPWWEVIGCRRQSRYSDDTAEEEDSESGFHHVMGGVWVQVLLGTVLTSLIQQTQRAYRRAPRIPTQSIKYGAQRASQSVGAGISAAKPAVWSETTKMIQYTVVACVIVAAHKAREHFSP